MTQLVAVWTVDSFPLASREVCLSVLVPVPLVQEPAEGLSAKKLGKITVHSKVDRLMILPRLPDVLKSGLKVKEATNNVQSP